MSEMTSRERVYAAANHQEPDRVPICFAGHSCSGITECPPDYLLTSKLYEHLGIEDADPPFISPWMNICLNVDERVLQRFRSDMRLVYAFSPLWIDEPDGTKTWPWNMGMRIKKTGLYDDPFEFPMKDMTTEEDIADYPWPDPANTPSVAPPELVDMIRSLQEETGYFLVADSFYDSWPFNGYAFVSGMDKWLIDMKIRPKFYHKLAERMLEITLQVDADFYSKVGPYVDAAQIYDDLGTQERLLMSPQDYREFYKPYTAEIVKNIRKYIRPEAKILLHSCGAISEVIPDLIEIGVDILNPVQPLAKNMEPERLKKEFGKDLCFMGGLDIQQLLPLGRPEEIREGAKKLIAQYGEGGGFIFAPSHNIEPDSSPKNICAMFDAAQEFGRYPVAPLEGETFVEYIQGLNLQDRDLSLKAL